MVILLQKRYILQSSSSSFH